MTLNRQQSPDFHKISELKFPEFSQTTLSNGVNLYAVKAGTEPVIRLDLVFEAGSIAQLKKAQATFTSSMLSEGTKNKSAIEIADGLDYYGSYFQARSSADDSVASLYCLEKQFENCLSLFLEAILGANFPEKELDIIRKNSIQKLLVSEKKNNYICRKTFYKEILGATHPYASFSEKADFKNIDTNDLKSFHLNNYLSGLKYIQISGKFDDKIIEKLSKEITNSSLIKNKGILSPISVTTNIGKHFIEKNDSVQSAIRIGKTSIARTHPDFRKLQILNLVFGGYFGSRLMKNIREDKGLTYGIYSVLEPYKHASVWYIDSDINTKNRALGLEEIYKELKKIRLEPIPTNELETAKNYFLGSFLRSLDGPFSIADRLKIIIDNDFSQNYYSDLIKTVNETNSEDLIQIANEYFTEANIVEVIVGKK